MNDKKNTNPFYQHFQSNDHSHYDMSFNVLLDCGETCDEEIRKGIETIFIQFQNTYFPSGFNNYMSSNFDFSTDKIPKVESDDIVEAVVHQLLEKQMIEAKWLEEAHKINKNLKELLTEHQIDPESLREHLIPVPSKNISMKSILANTKACYSE